MKLSEAIKKRPIKYFVTVWIIILLSFSIIYWLLTPIAELSLGSTTIGFGFLSIFQTLYVSLLVSTLLGLGIISYSGIYVPLIYIQAILSAIVMLIIAEKIVKKYVDTHAHQQNKKVNTLMLMMSVIRDDMDRILHDSRIKKKHIKIRDVESVIDGLYVVFLDMERIFSSKNIHRHKLKNMQYILLTVNLEDSMHKLYKFILYMEKNNIRWKDKSVEFWTHYILDTAEKIAINLEDSGMKSPKLAIAVANMREHSENIRKFAG